MMLDRHSYDQRVASMLVEIARFIAAMGVAVTLFGCSSTGPVQPAPAMVSSEQKTPMGMRDKSDNNAAQQMPHTQTQQTTAPAYLPCVQGPETLRFLDRLGIEERSLEGDRLQEFVGRLPPMAQQRLIKFANEAYIEAAKKGSGLHVTRDYEGFIYEEIAEEFIVDCSDRLARLSAVAALADMADRRAAEAVVRLWQENLQFMKWWLTNCRQKRQKVR